MPKGIYKRTKSVWNKGLTKHNSQILKKQGKEHSKRMKGRKGNRKSIDAMRNTNKGKKRNKKIRENIAKGRKGIIFSKEHKENLAKSMTGEKNPNWIGGITPEYSSRFNKSIWKNIRRLVLQRDNYTCKKCKIKQKILDVHHKKPWRFSKDDNSANLISLCRKCHRKEDSKLQDIAKKKREGRKVIPEYIEFKVEK